MRRISGHLLSNGFTGVYSCTGEIAEDEFHFAIGPFDRIEAVQFVTGAREVTTTAGHSSTEATW